MAAIKSAAAVSLPQVSGIPAKPAGDHLDRSAIEWTGPTWNPWQGCIKVSPGCKNCYMYRDKKRYGKDPAKVVRSAPATFDKPLKWQREVEAGVRTGQDRLVFTCSWSDWFIKQADGWRPEAWAIIRRCPGLIFQILTKRPERIAEHLPEFWDEIKDRVWLGVSVEDPAAEQRIGDLLKIDVGVRFLSVEPLLAAVDLSTHLAVDWVFPEEGDDGRAALARIGVGIGDEFLHASVAGFVQPMGLLGLVRWQNAHLVIYHAHRYRVTGWYTPQYGDSDKGCVRVDHGAVNAVIGQLRTGRTVGDPVYRFPNAKAPGIHWIIVGGESGPGARPFDVVWALAIVKQCRAAGVPCFVKQLGGHPIDSRITGALDHRQHPDDEFPFPTNAAWPMGTRVLTYADAGGAWLPAEIHLKDRKGGEMGEWPEEIRVREFPISHRVAMGTGRGA